MDLTLFNPRIQNEADFLASFVARGNVLRHFLQQFRLTTTEQPARHHLVVALRGFGKTSLLRRIAIAVRTEPELRARYLALSFREEQHNVLSLDVFWRNCLQSLLEAREDEGAAAEELDAIDAAWTRLAPRQNLRREEQDGEPAWTEFRSRCERLGRRPVLLVDNLDALLNGMDADHQWALRRCLQEAGGPFLLAAAARYPESTQDASAAFYDFFRVCTLDRLNDAEVQNCLRTLAQHRGESGRRVLELVDRDPGRVSALNTLAGGNPRTLGVLYSVLESHMSVDILSQLAAMLDTFTGWYEARTEELAPQARAVFDALALNWEPITAAALGEITGLDTPTVSSQLSRLERTGYVETVALSKRGKGRNGYQVAERFFNIWYLMRNGTRRTRQRIRFLTVCLQSFYTPAERRTLGRRVAADDRSDPGYVVALASSLGHGLLRERLLEVAESRSAALGKRDDYYPVIDELRTNRLARQRVAGEALAGSDRAASDVDAMWNRAFEAIEQGDPLQAIEILDRILGRLEGATEPALREAVARALVGKGFALGELGQREAAIEVYESVVSRFGDAAEAALREQVARALVNTGFVLGELGHREAAIEVYESVASRFGDAAEPALREEVARALVNKGVALGQLGQREAALEVYESVVSRFGDAAEPALREQVARALVGKGFALGQLGHREAALEVFESVVSRFGDAAEPALREAVTCALVNQGVVLGELGHREAAIEVYKSVVSRFGDAAEPALREAVARALVNQGVVLGELGHREAAIKVYESVVSRFGDAAEPALRMLVASALVNKGVVLRELGHREAALEVYESVVSRFGDAVEPALRELVARALNYFSQTMLELERIVDAEAALRRAVERAPEWASLHNSLGNLLLDYQGDPVAALAAYGAGLLVADNDGKRIFLHANSAYALALHGGDGLRARQHIEAALTVHAGGVSPAGRCLLEALPVAPEDGGSDWSAVFRGIGAAVASEDPALWTVYFDDLQRLLWFVLAHEQGDTLQRWMETEDYPLRQAPLYHAVRAAIEGEDHLLRINPEVRTLAAKIHAGIARRLALYGEQTRGGGRKRTSAAR